MFQNDLSNQSRGVEQVGDSEDGQTTHTGSDPTAVLQLAERESLALGQVELDVPLRQSLQGQTGEDTPTWTGEVFVSVTHLVVGQTTVVGDKQCGLDSLVTETLHELLPRLRYQRVVHNLLQKRRSRK